jgi:hypothetical protein
MKLPDKADEIQKKIELLPYPAVVIIRTNNGGVVSYEILRKEDIKG